MTSNGRPATEREVLGEAVVKDGVLVGFEFPPLGTLQPGERASVRFHVPEGVEIPTATMRVEITYDDAGGLHEDLYRLQLPSMELALVARRFTPRSAD